MTRGIYQPVRVDVQVRGEVPESAVHYVAEKVEHVMGLVNQSILSARAVLTMAPDPAMERPARAEASLDVNGTQVRAHAIASDMTGAVDLLEEKLRRNIVHLQDRTRTRHRWIGVASEEGWRRGTLPSRREDYFPRPAEEREVVRRKTFAMAPMTPDEAAYEMEMLGHDFYLFTDRDTGKEAVVYHDGDARFALRGDAVPAAESASLVEVTGKAPVLTETEAKSRLQLSGEPFVFYVDPDDLRGRVLYVRYDGHYGLITAA